MVKSKQLNLDSALHVYISSFSLKRSDWPCVTRGSRSFTCHTTHEPYLPGDVIETTDAKYLSLTFHMEHLQIPNVDS